MTKINIYGALADKYGSSFLMEIGSAKDVFDAIDANREGFKKDIFDLHSEGFDYVILVNKKKIETINDILAEINPEVIDLVPLLQGDGADPISGTALLIYAIITTIVSTAAAILLAPDPPKPPEITQTASALENSFTFANTVNRSAQGTPVPVCYGELIVGSEVIQATYKSYPQSQQAFSALRRNPFNLDGSAALSTSSQVI